MTDARGGATPIPRSRKAIVNLLSTRPDLQIAVLDCDRGVGIVRKGSPDSQLPYSAAQIEALGCADLVADRVGLLNLRPPTIPSEFLNSSRSRQACDRLTPRVFQIAQRSIRAMHADPPPVPTFGRQSSAFVARSMSQFRGAYVPREISARQAWLRGRLRGHPSFPPST